MASTSNGSQRRFPVMSVRNSFLLLLAQKELDANCCRLVLLLFIIGCFCGFRLQSYNKKSDPPILAVAGNNITTRLLQRQQNGNKNDYNRLQLKPVSVECYAESFLADVRSLPHSVLLVCLPPRVSRFLRSILPAFCPALEIPISRFSLPHHLITPSPPPLLSSPLSCSSPLAIGVHIYGRFDAVMWLRLCVMVIILIEVNYSENRFVTVNLRLQRYNKKCTHARAWCIFCCV